MTEPASGGAQPYTPPAQQTYSNNSQINSIANANANVTGLRTAISNCTDSSEMLALSMELMNAQQVLTMMVESFTKSSKVQHDAGKKGMNVQGS